MHEYQDQTVLTFWSKSVTPFLVCAFCVFFQCPFFSVLFSSQIKLKINLALLTLSLVIIIISPGCHPSPPLPRTRHANAISAGARIAGAVRDPPCRLLLQASCRDVPRGGGYVRAGVRGRSCLQAGGDTGKF